MGGGGEIKCDGWKISREEGGSVTFEGGKQWSEIVGRERQLTEGVFQGPVVRGYF